jgi:hypothetical protein
MTEGLYQHGKKRLGPTFLEQRSTNDGVHVGDVGFKKQLWTLDPELDVVWNNIINRWEIWKFPGQKNRKIKALDPRAKFVMAVQTKNRTFRELGADILLQLQEFSFERFTVKQLCEYLDKQDDNIRRAKRKQLEDNITAMIKETQSYARGVTKIVVPGKRDIQDKDKKFLLNLPKPIKQEVKVFTAKTSQKLAHAIREC